MCKLGEIVITRIIQNVASWENKNNNKCIEHDILGKPCEKVSLGRMSDLFT